MTTSRMLRLLQVAVLSFAGCSTPSDNPACPNGGTLTFRVEEANYHLGHSSAVIEGKYFHPDWIDGCIGRLVGSDEIFVIWWRNNEIKDLPWRFEKEKTHVVQFQGEIGDGILGHEGKCLRVLQIVKMEEKKE